MATTHTDLITLLATDLDKTGKINDNIQQIDDLMNAPLSIDSGDANVTLTGAQQYHNGMIRITGALTAGRDLTFIASRAWHGGIWNDTTGGFDLTIKYPSGGTTVALGMGLTVQVQLDGTNVLTVSRDSTAPPADAAAMVFTPVGTITATNPEDALYQQDQSISEDLPITITADRLLTATEFGHHVFFNLTGSPAVDFLLETPSGAANIGFKVISNGTGRICTVAVDAAGGETVDIPAGQATIVYVDATDVAGISSAFVHSDIEPTDATETSLVEIPIPSGQAVTVTLWGQAIEAATGDDFHFKIKAWGANVGGTSSLTGTIARLIKSAGASAWTMVADVDDAGDVLRYRFTGEAAHTIRVTGHHFAVTRV